MSIAIDAAMLIADCEQYAVKIEIIDSERLALDPIFNLPRDVLAAIKAKKIELIRLLQTVNALEPPLQYGYRCFLQILKQKRQNLISKNYNPKQAAVHSDEFRKSLVYNYQFNYDDADIIKRELINVDLITQHGSYLYPIDNDQ